MATLVCCCPVAAATSAPDAEGQSLDAPIAVAVPGFAELAQSDGETLSYEQSRTVALTWLEHAGPLNAPLVGLARSAATHLARARFMVAADQQGDLYCSAVAASLFVLQTVPDTIFICADTRWHVQQSGGDPVIPFLAQSFLHEAVHLAGTTDECQATLLELSVTTNNIGAANVGNMVRYGRQCAGVFDNFSVPRVSRRKTFQR